MSAEVAHMECCGCKELHYLEGIELTPKGATKFLIETKEQLSSGGHYQQHYDWKTGIYTQGEWVDEEFVCPAVFIFSQAGTPLRETGDHGAYGDILKAYIDEQGLGTVTVTDPVINENSGNIIKVYTWTVNRTALKAWTGGKTKAKHKKEAA